MSSDENAIRRSFRVSKKCAKFDNSYVRPIPKTKKRKRSAKVIRRRREKMYADIFTSVMVNSKILYYRLKEMESTDEEEEFESEDESPEEVEVEEEEEVEVVVKTEPRWEEGCICGEKVFGHTTVHRHIVETHDATESDHCVVCRKTFKDVFNEHVCIVCFEFAEDLADHLASHYRTSTSTTALMECRYCPKNFATVGEVIEHEFVKHNFKKLNKPTVYNCSICGQSCYSVQGVEWHMITHYSSEKLWSAVISKQAVIGADRHECPFCRYLLSSRKRLKIHVILKHSEIVAEINGNNGIANSADNEEDVIEIKKEVKDEIIEDGL